MKHKIFIMIGWAIIMALGCYCALSQLGIFLALFIQQQKEKNK